MTQTSEWILGAALVATLLTAMEASFRIARRHHARTGREHPGDVGTLQASLLGLLALLLGFTLSMSLSRFEHRKALVLEESNAISTTYLRASFLPEESRRSAQALLRNYVDARLAFYAAGVETDALLATLREAERLHGELWRIAAAGATQAPTSVPIGLFIESVNEVIDVHDKRVRALEDHVPESVLGVLWLVAIGAFGLIGYEGGLKSSRRSASAGVVAVLVTVVVVVIVDLDRPRRGLIRVSQAAMQHLKDTVQP